MNTFIRQATEKDLESILEIVNYNILNTTSIYDYEPRTLAQQKAIFDDKNKEGFPLIVVEIDNEIAGFGTYGTFRFKEGYKFTVEHSVYVSVNHKGKGLGKLLLAELIELAKKQKLHTMIAVIDAENQSSVEFHKQFGFETVGVIKESAYKFNKWLDTVFMQLIL
ncbi:N-acetyltransferase family protein [uncultured Flavobacterium sp.]|uniref:GNAT family N-acetyltransferase n=1 Tax=uncultured Flavobacterium sp. TaxID=165435 RepID=UPI0030EE18C9|tara:strand:+ start:38614 stop:39108 length:495 start_codon:yes stop_codon:yes gene_type:complete